MSRSRRLHWRHAIKVRAAIEEAQAAIDDFSRRHGGWLPPDDHEERMRRLFAERDANRARHEQWRRTAGLPLGPDYYTGGRVETALITALLITMFILLLLTIRVIVPR